MSRISHTMRLITIPSITLLIALTGLWVGCEEQKTGHEGPKVVLRTDLDIPDFQADTAYAYVVRQLEFGPRVPNSAGHAAAANWLSSQLEATGAKVTVQSATVEAFDGTPLNMNNIIASFNPEETRRVMLSAHWDTRPFADQDTSHQDEPIPGANDGASGVAVLLEIARQFQKKSPYIGVDIVLWDTEDYGKSGYQNSYCLGSQYWARNKHVANYRAMWGINLDMVGAKGATFPREGQSRSFNPVLVDKVWKTGQLLGYGQYFVDRLADGIVDDHVYISTQGGVPMIDIIDIPAGGGFFEHWHTQRDDLESISRETMKAVGQTVLQVVYSEGAPAPENPTEN